MKRIYVVFIMMLISCVTCHAQAKRTTVKTKKVPPAREYKVESDGFEWYKTYKSGKYGAEDKNHNTLIPTEYSEISYNTSASISGIPSGFWAKKDAYYSWYDFDGLCVIPYTRHYTFITKHFKEQIGIYYSCDRENGFTFCDINGKEIISFNLDRNRYKYMFPVWDEKHNVFYFLLQTSDEHWGLADGNGNIIVSDFGLSSLIDYFPQITTKTNPFANNPTKRTRENTPNISNTAPSGSSSKVFPYSYSYDSSSRSHIYKMDKAETLEGIASIQMQMIKNSKGIQLMLDLFETKSNSIIASWANKANRQGGTISGTGVTLNLSNGAKENVVFILQDHRNESFKTDNYGLVYLFVPLSSSSSSSKLSNSLSTYDIKSITYDNKTFQIDVPTAATIKSMFDAIKVK